MSSQEKKKQGKTFALLQRLGRSLMLPIASLPAAALILRLGQADMLGADGLAAHAHWLQPVADVMASAGNAIIGNLAYLFALGVAIGFAKKSDGSTALAALIGYFVFKSVTDTLAPHFGVEKAGACADAVEKAGLNAADFACAAPTYDINYGVLGGIAVGLLTAVLYQKYYRVKLPQYLAFFGGRRFVPIVTALWSIVLGVVLSLIYPAFNLVFNEGLGGFIKNHGANPATGFVFGTVNRLLIPFGLHHLLNSLPWFQLGDCVNADGATVHGDITCFLSGVNGTNAWTGSFMTGFFPIMMFGLLGAALAFYRTARPENRKAVGGVMVSLALTSFITGVTEPIEFAFAYCAWPLYLVHALLTGSSLALVNALGIKSGFGFSAGLIDYLLNLTKAAGLSGGYGKVLLLIPIGLVYAVIYYFLFVWAIKKFNLPTPGREGADDTAGSMIFDKNQIAGDDKKATKAAKAADAKAADAKKTE
ncbi:MAG: PTS transporter subunit EIIC [Actinomycetaceae bacterium]|nr:PTS transporter subunit EIIC [Actinomycetaceae bacterium]MDU0970586.1 PTS transporter subunit EIIC [Actinomycetaceae bacterium]